MTVISNINQKLILLYLVAILFLYPYGVTIAGGNFRLPDFVAAPVIFLSLATLFYKGKFYNYPLLLTTVALFIFAEIFFPFLAVIVGYDGLGAIGNSLRMSLIWLPMFSYAITNTPAEGKTIDSGVSRILRWTIIINLCYGILQMAVRATILPESILITKTLEPFAVDDHFRVQDGFRASGFFTNTSSLSIFGIISLSYFFAKYAYGKNRKDGLFALLGFVLILITLSRAAMFTAALVILICWLFLDYKTKVISSAVFAVALIILFFIVDHYIGVEILFNRIIFVIEFGLEYDNSFGARMYRIWPLALQELRAYPFGTFSSPTEKIGLIDSGYLTYYAQGKWVFIFILFLFLVSILIRGMKSFSNKRNWATIMLLSISLYIVGSMIVLIPLRSALIIFFLLFAVWMSETKVSDAGKK